MPLLDGLGPWGIVIGLVIAFVAKKFNLPFLTPKPPTPVPGPPAPTDPLSPTPTPSPIRDALLKVLLALLTKRVADESPELAGDQDALLLNAIVREASKK